MPPSTPPPAGPPLGSPVLGDAGAARRRRHAHALDPSVLAAVAAGGIAGAEARYALSLWHPPAPGQWSLTTWAINVGGSFLLGALVVVLTELTSPHRLIRPFLGVGVLGGFTTFSTAMVDVHQLATEGQPLLALAYLIGTALGALVAVLAGTLAVRGAAAAWTRRRNRTGATR